MGDITNISWADHTFNGWRGCEHAELNGEESPGCANCYAENRSGRNPAVLGTWGPDGVRVLAAESYWRQLDKWYAAALQDGVARRVFCASLADMFEAPKSLNNIDVVNKGRKRLFDTIDRMPLGTRADGLRTGLVFMLLTKRPQNIARMVPEHWLGDAHLPVNSIGSCALCQYYGPGPRHNCPKKRFPNQVWLGTSIENQEAANDRLRHMMLLTRRASDPITYFFSFEPLIGEVDMQKAFTLLREDDIDNSEPLAGSWWLIGGESGAVNKVRAMDVAWAESLMNQATEFGAYRHMKQRGRLWYDQKRREGIRGSCIVPVDGMWQWVDQKHQKGGDPSEWPAHLQVRELLPGYAWDMSTKVVNNVEAASG